MFVQVKHVTRYSYSHPVFCDPLTLRLRPREDATQRLLRYRVEITPSPAGCSEHNDLANNQVTLAWFQEVTLSLAVTTSFLVETLITNPYNFLLEPEALALPLRAPADPFSHWAYYLREDEPSSAVQQFATEVAQESGWQTVSFLSALALRIFARTERMIREEGDAWPAETTLREAKGSCRDLAVLFNACCRAMGLPARFVSGYSPSENDPHLLYMHAWSEVYLPGAGWRGFDASRGLAVSDQHVALAAGRTPAEAAPTHGTFRSNGARSGMQTQIAMSITAHDPRGL